MTTDRVPRALQDLTGQQLDDAAAVVAGLAATSSSEPLREAWADLARDLRIAAETVRPKRRTTT